MPDQYPLGLNINMGALRSWALLVDTCRVLNSSHQMAMIGASNNPRNDIDGVMRLHQAIGNPSLQWLIRVFSEQEGEWRKYNVNDYVNYCAEIHRHFPNVIFDAPSNEPGVPDNEVKMFIDNQIELIEKFAAKGMRYAACCYGVGSPHHEWISGGRFDDLIRTLAKYDTAYLSLHEYTMGWLEAGSGFGYEILLDPANLSKYWLTKWAVQEGHYLIRRSDYWALRADAIGVRRPRVYYTERQLDQIPDTVTQLNNRFGGAWDSMRHQYGLQRYNFDLRGVNSYVEFYEKVFPNLSYDEALAKIHIHDVEDCLYVDYVQAGFLFAWNTNWDEPEGSDYSIEARLPFFRLLANHAKTYVRNPQPIPTPEPVPTPEPQPEPTFIIMRIQGNGVRVNLRKEPNKDSAILGTLAAAPTVTTVEVSTAPSVDPNGFQWRQVRYNGLQGWLAWQFIVPAPEPLDPRVLILLDALKVVRNGYVDEVAEDTASILYVDEILAQFDQSAG